MGHEQHVPRGALLGALGLIVASLGLAATARSARLAAPPAVTRAPLQSADIRFEDLPDGSLAVDDAPTGRRLAGLPPGSNGFIRGVLRGMFRERKLESLGHDAVFTLSREADGRLALLDPQTGRRIDLDSFGPTNSAAFAALLVTERPRP